MSSSKIVKTLVGVIKVILDIIVAVVLWLSCDANWIAFIAVFYIAIFWCTKDIASLAPERTSMIIDMPEIKTGVIEHKTEETAK